jgi:hypothetical protein
MERTGEQRASEQLGRMEKRDPELDVSGRSGT